MGLMQKRSLLVSDHRNNQLNSRLNKKAEQENWESSHAIIQANKQL